MGCYPGTKAKHEIHIVKGVTADRCPIACLLDLRPEEQLEIDHIIRLAYAKRSGALSPYPGNYTYRALCLLDVAETEILRIYTEMSNPGR